MDAFFEDSDGERTACSLLAPAGKILLNHPGDRPIDEIKKYMIDKHVKFTEEAAKQGVKILCFQEIFYGPYFCAEQETKWYGSAEPIVARVPDSVARMPARICR